MQQLKLLVALSGIAGVFGAGFAPRAMARIGETLRMPEKTAGCAADIGRGGPPRPTSPPSIPFGEMELVKRFSGYTMGSDTCGFVASLWGTYLQAVSVRH